MSQYSEYHRSVGGHDHPQTLFPNALLELGKQGCVIGRQIGNAWRGWDASLRLFQREVSLLWLFWFTRHSPAPFVYLTHSS